MSDSHLVIQTQREAPAAPVVSVPLAVKAGLWMMAIFALIAGIPQQFMPRFFHDSFPGFGRHWVSVSGPYNEHLLRDLGGANLALAVVTFFAILQPSAGVIRAIAAATLVAQVPHFVYHAIHLNVLPTPLDRVLQTAALTMYVLIPIFVLIGSREIREAQGSQHDADALKSQAAARPAPGLIADRTR